MPERLDEERLETLRRWGEGLLSDPRDEVRAAGRAIQLLIEEIEMLHVDLWRERTPEPGDLPERLRARLRRFSTGSARPVERLDPDETGSSL